MMETLRGWLLGLTAAALAVSLLTALVAQWLGANVIGMDYEPEALRFARRNAEHNAVCRYQKFLPKCFLFFIQTMICINFQIFDCNLIHPLFSLFCTNCFYHLHRTHIFFNIVNPEKSASFHISTDRCCHSSFYSLI